MPPSTGLTDFLGHFRPARHHRCCPGGRHAVLGALVAAGAGRPRTPDTRSMSSPVAPSAKTCLVTGATGYIGGRLVPELLAAGHRVRVMSRSPERLRDHPWAGDVEIVRADAGDAEQGRTACAGVDVVYYLIHALGTGPTFEETDRRTARVMVEAVRAAGVGRLVYL